jgi:hypothetical protein
MTVRLRASVIPGMLALSASALTACTSQGTIGAGASGGPIAGTSGASTPAANSSADTSAVIGTSAPSSAATDSPASAPASSSQAAPSSEDPSALASSLKTLNQLWKDPGCKIALDGFSTYLYAQQAGPAQGIAAIPNAVPKIRAGAQQTKKPDAAQAMNKLAADLLTMYSAAQEGKTPDKGPVRTDWQIMGNVCSTGNQ